MMLNDYLILAEHLQGCGWTVDILNATTDVDMVAYDPGGKTEYKIIFGPNDDGRYEANIAIFSPGKKGPEYLGGSAGLDTLEDIYKRLGV